MMDSDIQDLRADVALLLECIKCQIHSPAAVKQTLLTIASMCTTQENAKDILREHDGLKFILNILISGTDIGVKEAAMFALGCAMESNVFSQKLLCRSSTFVYLHKMLGSHQSGVRLIQTTSFLILALTTNNSMGQTLVRKSDCLEVLLELFKSTLPVSVGAREKRNENSELRSIELWTSVTSALSACVNNPQNEENQRMCSRIFPHAFQLLQDGTQPHVLRPLASFIGLTVANNVHNQDRADHSGVLEVLINAVDRILSRSSHYNSDHQLAVALTNTIDTIITDHPRNAARCGSLGGITLFLQLLQTNLESTAALQVVLTLAHCTEDCERNQHEVVAQGGIPVLIQQLSQGKNEALTDAIKYVLQTCVHVDDRAEQQPCSPTITNLKSVSNMVKSPEERKRKNETMSQFVDVIKQRLDSLEASLLSAHQRTSEVYSESMVDATVTRMTATPGKLAQWTKFGNRWTADATTSETCALATSATRADKPTASRQNLVACRQVGTSTGEDTVCGMNESKRGSLIGYVHLGTDTEDKPIGGLGNWQDKASDTYRQVATNTGNRADQNMSRTASTYTQVGNYTTEREGYGKTDPCERELYRHEGNYTSEREGYGKTYPWDGKSCRHEATTTEPRTKSMRTPQRTSPSWAAAKSSVTHRRTVAQQTNFTPYRPVPVGNDGDQTVDQQGLRDRTMSVCSPAIARTTRDPILDQRGPQERTMSVCSPAVARISRDLIVHQRGPRKKTMTMCSSAMARTGRDPTSQDTVAADQSGEELRQERALRESLQTELDRARLVLSQRDSGQCRKADHASQLMAELRRQQKEQEEKDRQVQKMEAVQDPQTAIEDGDQQIAPPSAATDWQSHFTARRQAKPAPVVQQAEATTNHRQPVVITRQTGMTHSQSGVVIRVSPQLSQVTRDASPANRRRLSQRGGFSSDNRSTSLPRSECGNSTRKTTTKSPKTTLAVKSQLRVSTSATAESDHDGVFLRPSLPLRRGQRGTCASTSPREPAKRRLFAVNSKADKLKLQPVVQPRPLAHVVCTKKAADLCPSPVQSEFDLQLLKTSTEERDEARSHCQCRPTGMWSAGGQTELDGNRTPRQSTSGRLVNRASYSAVAPCRQLSHSCHYSTEGDTDSDTSKHNTWVRGTKYSREKVHNLKCPGCQPPELIQGSVLNSYTYNIALETSSGTCHTHRQIREAERRAIHVRKQNLPRNRGNRKLQHRLSVRAHVNRKSTQDPFDVYHFPTEASSSDSVSPPSTDVSVASAMCRSVSSRRPRVVYSRQEEDNLMEGVERFGHCWNQILHSYVFHPTRMAVDLKGKYRRLMAKRQWTPEPAEKRMMERRPFSMVEERRLRRGVHLFGYNWKAIQGAYQFAKGRSATELRSKWRSMHRPKLLHHLDMSQ